MKPDIQALLRKASESLEAARMLQERGYYDIVASRA